MNRIDGMVGLVVIPRDEDTNRRTSDKELRLAK